MRKKTLLLRVLVIMMTTLLFYCSETLSAQDVKVITLTGAVTDASGKPVAGATVAVQAGTTTTVATDAAGIFRLTVPLRSVLIISSVGFETQQVTVTEERLNVVLQQSASEMDQVVVVGYGTRKKSDVTGAIASVSGDNLRSVPVTNLTQALQGRVTGVVATPNSFKPGSGNTIRIRGNRSLSASNEPLYVVDGFPVSYTIDDMNPADIESVDILKDASSTAIYGVRGANGVVQITTKKGKAGKVNVTYMGSKSVEKIMRPLPVFNGAELADAWRQAFFADRQYTANRGTASATNPLYYYPTATNDIALFWTRFGSQEQWNAIKDAYTWNVYDPDNGIFIARKRATTPEERSLLQGLGITSQLDSIDLYDPSKVRSYDWQDKVGLRNGSTDNHSISVSGGSDKIRASLNAGYFKQKGIEWGQDYTRYAIGNSVEFRPAKFLNFGTSINYIHSITNTSTSSFGNASGMIPLVTPYDSAGNWVMFPNKDQQIINAINDRNTVFDETKANRVFGNIYGEVTLLKGLKYRAMFGADIRSSVRGQFNGAQSSVRLGSAANATQTDNRASSWVFDNIVTYNTSIKSDHTLNFTLLHELQSLNRSSSLAMSANNLIFESQKWYSLQRNTDAIVTGSGTYSASQYLSYMARVEYGFRNKYLLTLSNRYDNSSVLSEGNKGAWFPSASVAWQLDREGFFANQKTFSAARLRAGIGKVGNASINPYQTGGPLGFTNYNWGNGTAAVGSAPTTFPTPDLTWEKTTTTNLGIEFGLFNNRISGAVDLYNANTTDQLQERSIPAANGVTTVFFNLGKVNNRGIEISLSTRNIVKEHFQWNSDFMFSKNKEKIVDIDGTGNSNFANLWLLGEPLQVYRSYQKEGVFQYSDTAAGGVLASVYWPKNGRANTAYQPGKIKIYDANGDSSYSEADKVVLGSHNPDFIASVNNTFTYRNFELNFLAYFRVGGLYRVPRPGLVGRYQSNKVNYWTPSNPVNDYQQPTQTSDIPLYWEALTYRDATFIKVRNITLTYRLPQGLVSRMHTRSFAIYVSAVNPILIHNGDKGYDPETVPYREFAGNTTSQVGPNSYSYRSYVLGVRVDL
ncbi:SusC/RagA family TonB-linked outer membrane protein [Niabella beijingensis]|uniref:SusC/RagA family TonB-linked outer membrane protein n=1 Tax=Niabella beijingensis TaxID=2872700 RepID=UPI001CBE8808|nr:SusC/RagA family TonB-linked outer membrane protein [Niabella beijingensis]MBZ4192191.1 SusC/RagA family TonB-linked outer membrane protein [Niabella beijingensis]